MSSVFTLVDPADLRAAHRKVLPRVVRATLDSFERSAPTSRCEELARCGTYLEDPGLPDTPELRAFLYSARQYAGIVAEGNCSYWPATLHHLALDSADPARPSELLRFQALGIAISAALERGTRLEFRTRIEPPVSIAIPNIGCLYFAVAGGPGMEATVAEGEAVIRHAGKEARLSIRRGHSLDTTLRLVEAVSSDILGQSCEVPIHDAALAQPAFQSLPLLTGAREVRRFAAEVASAARWLAGLELPNLGGVLAWCRACLGLVSIGEQFGSGSRLEALGLVYLPVGRPLYELAECLLHEAMHQHLFRLDGVAPLLEPECDSSERYYSPWRSDPRPLIMTLHGAYVFTAVAELYQVCLNRREPAVPEPHALKTVYRRARQALAALQVVRRYGRLTGAGTRAAAQTGAHAERLLQSAADQIGNADRASIDTELEQHREKYRDYLG
jgi:HEXXH motif-containing protein